jgi:2,4-diaminopentanoate dehydrogenase
MMAGPPENRRYRVVQWATGNVGSRTLRRAIEHPLLDLVGVWVHSADKVGKDAGELAGVGATGVKATNSIEDVIALKPDCILYMPHQADMDDVCRLLESGANIVTTRTEFQNPKLLSAEVFARIEAACIRGGSSIHGTGSSPGFITEAVPIVLTSIQRRLDCLTIHEFGDNSTRNSPKMLFEVMGFGKTAREPSAATLAHLREAFGPSLQLVADAIGLPLDTVEVRGGLGFARQDVTIAAGLVPAGTVAAMRTIVEGFRQGKVLLRFVATWFVSSDVDTSDGEEWEFRDSGWRVKVEGDCPLDIEIRYPQMDAAAYAQMTPGLTAHRPINVVSYICEAPPGIRTTIDLPQIIAQLG